jgi:hypothetical protein
MADKTFTFTIEQIKEIYRAGIRRGIDVQSAYDWGSSPTSKEFDECVSVIYDIVNEGINWGKEGYTDYPVIESWFE